MNPRTVYEDADMLVIDKPAGTVVFHEAHIIEHGAKSIIEYLVAQNPEFKKAGEAPRYGIVHRLDKDTSGLLLVAKTTEALIFLQKQFTTRTLEKRYIALATGTFKEDKGVIETLIGRAPKDRRQKAYPLDAKIPDGRLALTEYKVLQRFAEYTLLEITMKTGRKHQIRCHLAHIHHPIAGDALYGFKDSPLPAGLTRQFLHASYLKIQLPSGENKEFFSELPHELAMVLRNLSPQT